MQTISWRLERNGARTIWSSVPMICQPTRRPSCRPFAIVRKLSIDRIREVYALLAKEGHGEHILVDLGEIRAFDYYTGLVFNIFIEGSGWELGGGGRYDHLVGCFGPECPSTGFAFDLGRLFRLLD